MQVFTVLLTEEGEQPMPFAAAFATRDLAKKAVELCVQDQYADEDGKPTLKWDDDNSCCEVTWSEGGYAGATFEITECTLITK